MLFTDLPTMLVIPGKEIAPAKFSLRFCSDADGVIVLPIWTSIAKATACQSKKYKHMPITEADRETIILGAAEHNTCSFMYVDPIATDPIIDSDSFSVAKLNQKKLLRVRNLALLWPIAQLNLEKLGADEQTLAFIKKTWERNSQLNLPEAATLADRILSKGTWLQEMYCGHCGNKWQTGQMTPPLACPKCKSEFVSPEMVL